MSDETVVKNLTITKENSRESDVDVTPLERPEFYHERISYKMGSDFGILNSKLAQIYLLIETEAKDETTPEEKMAVSVAKSEALVELGDLVIERDAFFLRFIKSIPRSWLIEGAPRKIDDGEWLDWVRRDRFTDLNMAYQEDGVRRREETKN